MKTTSNNYIEELKAIYVAEITNVETLPQKIQNAATSELAMAFEKHLQFAKQHLQRLEEIFVTIGESVCPDNFDKMEII